MKREQLARGPSRREKNHALSRDGPAAGGMARSFFDAPEVFACQWIIAIVRFGAAADQNRVAAREPFLSRCPDTRCPANQTSHRRVRPRRRAWAMRNC